MPAGEAALDIIIPSQHWLPIACFALFAALGALAVRHVQLAAQIGHMIRRLQKHLPISTENPLIQQMADAAETIDEHFRCLKVRLDQRHGTTGLPTREPLLSRMEEDKKGNLSVIAFLDFDRLCTFDTDLADRALKQFASRIVRMIGKDRMSVQVDRAHFAVWFGHEVSDAEAEAELTAMSYALGEVLSDADLQLMPEVRVHHAAFSTDMETPSQALMRLLAACDSKDRGPARVTRVDTQSANHERGRFHLEQDLRNAIVKNELSLLFQPQIDASTGCVRGAEALLRWNSSTHGLVSPNIFIPLLESAQLIDEVGLWVLNAACREARKWQAPSRRQLSVAVNVSSYQLDHADITKRIERTLKAQGLSPHLLEIELTESAAAANVSRVAELFDSLRARGIHVAIDDFGTGFSSLSALRAVSFDKIKIDREFVTEVERRRDSQAICQSIIALSRGLGIRVLAEGVERHEEYFWLRKHGCHEFQGFYFSKPLTGPEFQSFAKRPLELFEKLALDPHALQNSIAERLA